MQTQQDQPTNHQLRLFEILKDDQNYLKDSIAGDRETAFEDREYSQFI